MTVQETQLVFEGEAFTLLPAQAESVAPNTAERWLLYEVHELLVGVQSGIPVTEIASMLGRTPGACYSKVYRMRQGKAGVDSYLKRVLR